ncbi:hypothetical protein [Kordia jejudonensis]|uniref:hypothetical protein n=1 Tax=Kordia jejudonensis TaxID=1348245 RepID=UPI0006297DAF|nr:hypothetical protein [Kordia jejudonensis]
MKHRFQNIINEFVDLIVKEGYSCKDSFSLILNKYYVNGKSYITKSDFQEIYNRSCNIASNIIVTGEKEGTLKRKKRILKKNPLKTRVHDYENNFSPLFSGIYGDSLTFKQKIEIKFKEFNYVNNNVSKTINQLMKYFKIDASNSLDKIRLNTIFSVVKELRK